MKRICKYCYSWDEQKVSGEDRGLCLASDEPTYGSSDSCFGFEWACPECGSMRLPEFRDGLRCLNCGWRES